MPSSACKTCGALTDQTYCPRHRLKTSARQYGSEWQRIVKELIRQHPYCALCGHRGSKDNPLTGDHVVPLRLGGKGPLRVYCRSCNVARSNRARGTRNPEDAPIFDEPSPPR